MACSSSFVDDGIKRTDLNFSDDTVLFQAKSGMLDPKDLALAFNEVLPGCIRINDVSLAPANFDSMENKWKRYRYTLPENPDELQSFKRFLYRQHKGKEYEIEEDLHLTFDFEAMKAAAQNMVGEHDF
eukprot:gene28799-35759_t